MPWAEQAIAEGAGEILITSIDRDGTGEGFVGNSRKPQE